MLHCRTGRPSASAKFQDILDKAASNSLGTTSIIMVRQAAKRMATDTVKSFNTGRSNGIRTVKSKVAKDSIPDNLKAQANTLVAEFDKAVSNIQQLAQASDSWVLGDASSQANLLLASFASGREAADHLLAFSGQLKASAADARQATAKTSGQWTKRTRRQQRAGSD